MSELKNELEFRVRVEGHKHNGHQYIRVVWHCGASIEPTVTRMKAMIEKVDKNDWGKQLWIEFKKENVSVRLLDGIKLFVVEYDDFEDDRFLQGSREWMNWADFKAAVGSEIEAMNPTPTPPAAPATDGEQPYPVRDHDGEWEAESDRTEGDHEHANQIQG